MEVIKWSCEEEEDKIKGPINKFKEKYNDYRRLFEQNLITENMLKTGLHDVEKEIFEYMKMVSANDSNILFCPICNELRTNHHITEGNLFVNFETVGNYMEKRSGRYGEFYGCIHYPNCTKTYSIRNGKPIITGGLPWLSGINKKNMPEKYFIQKNELQYLYDIDEDIDDYVSPFDFGDRD